MKADEEIIGYIKITGDSVKDGVISARSASNILNSVDRLMSRAIKKRYPDLAGVELDIPVKVQKGSWEALIPSGLVDWVITGAGLSATAYMTTAAKKMAENDFNKKGVKEAAKSGIKTLQNVVKLHKHLKGNKTKKIDGIKFKDNNQVLSIPDESGNYIDVPKNDYDEYFNFPEGIIKELAESPTSDQTLHIGRQENNQVIEEDIKYEDRPFFGLDKDVDQSNSDALFPELRHGDEVELTGEVTRGNNQSNSIGFKYKGHIITCHPATSKVSDFKEQMFSKCIIRGTISRVNDMTFVQSNRPHINFHELEIIEEDDGQVGLFSE